MPWSKAIAVTSRCSWSPVPSRGWAWQQFAPLAQYTVDENGGALGEEQMTKVFGPDGMFTAIGFLTALVLGAVLFWWLRNYGPWAVGIVVLGSALGAAVAWGVGMLLGHDPLQPRLEATKPGDLLAAPLELHTWTPLAVLAGRRSPRCGDHRGHDLACRSGCNRIGACRVRIIAAGALTCFGPVVRPPATRGGICPTTPIRRLVGTTRVPQADRRARTAAHRRGHPSRTRTPVRRASKARLRRRQPQTVPVSRRRPGPAAAAAVRARAAGGQPQPGQYGSRSRAAVRQASRSRVRRSRPQPGQPDYPQQMQGNRVTVASRRTEGSA